MERKSDCSSSDIGRYVIKYHYKPYILIIFAAPKGSNTYLLRGQAIKPALLTSTSTLWRKSFVQELKIAKFDTSNTLQLNLLNWIETMALQNDLVNSWSSVCAHLRTLASEERSSSQTLALAPTWWNSMWPGICLYGLIDILMYRWVYRTFRNLCSCLLGLFNIPEEFYQIFQT